MKKQTQRSGRQILLRIVFLLYVCGMLWLLFGQRMGTQIYTQQLADGINLVPLATVNRYLYVLKHSSSDYLLGHALMNLLGNVVLFVPLGYFLPNLGRSCRGFFKTMLLSFVLISTVELVQYFTHLGSCDIDDLLLNLGGTALGYPIWRLTRH